MAQPFRSLSAVTVRRLLRWLGVLVLLGGLSTGAAIWISHDRLERQELARHPNRVHEVTILDPLAPEDSNRYAQNVELYYGKGGLLMDKTTRWLEHLSHGKPLAWTVATVSLVVAGGLFLLVALYRPQGA